MDISNLIQNIDNLNAMTLRELKNMTERFPFYHLARLLYVVNLYKMHEPNLSEELTKASILLPDRTVLFNMIEGKNYQFERGDESKVLVEKDENRTVALIDRFLENINDDTDNESRKEARMMPTIAELTNDYASFLQMKDDSSLEETDDINSSLSQDSLIDSFIQENKGKQRYNLNQNDCEPIGPQDANNDNGKEIYNENIVNIYIKQGRYQQALEILKTICLNNPEKSTIFATQMRLLETIVNNNKQ